MTPAARIAAAIEILTEFGALDTPVEVLLKRWFRGHRFAGSKDRRSIRDRVYLVLRHRGEIAHQIGSENPRLLVAASLMKFEPMGLVDVVRLFDAGKYAPDALDGEELGRLEDALAGGSSVPASASANFPQWLEDHLLDAFGEDLPAEMEALVGRAPVDLRVNTLKMTRDSAVSEFNRLDLDVKETKIAPFGLRMAKSVALENSDLFRSGCIEIQDEGSQIAAKLVAVRPGQICVDFCAGAGGKTLAMAVDMEGHGRIHCFDVSSKRMSPLAERTQRAGVSTADWHVLSNPSTEAVLGKLENGVDRVLVDAPCSGTGTWRRAPDAKWLLTQEKLETYCLAQAEVLRKAASLVRPGGRLIYVTCSVLPLENDGQVSSFLEEDGRFEVLDWKEVWSEALPFSRPPPACGTRYGLLLTPLRTETDGFYVSILERR